MKSLKNNVPEILIGIALILMPFIASPLGFNSDMLSRILIWGLFGIGFDLLFGYTGLISFGQAAFFGFGGFLCGYILKAGAIDNAWLAMLIGTLSAGALAVVVGLLCLRRAGLYFAMITIAFGEVAYFLNLSPLSRWTGGENGLSGIPTPYINLFGISYEIKVGWPLYVLIAVIFWLGFLIARRLINSSFGMVLKAILQNETRTKAVGHSALAYKLAVFVIAGLYSGLAGTLFGMLQSYMPPEAFHLENSTQLVIQGLIGGAGTLIGPTIGAIIWIWLQNTLQFVPVLEGAWKLMLGIIFVFLIMVLPGGICGWARDYYKRRKNSGRGGEEKIHEGAIASGGEIASGMPARAKIKEYEHTAREETSRAGGEREAHHHAEIAMEAVDVSKYFGGIKAVEGVSIKVPRGQLRAIIGPNGAGKSTFFKLLSGEMRPTKGRIFLDGSDVTRLGVTNLCHRGVAKSYQINELFKNLTVFDNVLIAILAKRMGKFRLDCWKKVTSRRDFNENVYEILELTGLTQRANSDVDALEYGTKRRLEIALALASSPDYLLLDEPLAGVSMEGRGEIKDLIRRIRKERTVLIIEHDMDAIFELADYVTVLDQGRLLAEGSVDEIRVNADVRRAYLGGME